LRWFTVFTIRYLLPIAEDADTGINTVKSYKLSQNEHFSLDVQSGGEHGVSAELVLQKALDREKQSMIRLLLTAIDGGKPPRSGTIELIVNVIDVNDNIPTFSKSLYKVRVNENAIPGTVVVKLNATDLDEGMNSKILYSLVKRGTIDRSNIFDVNSDTGEITVKGTLDYEDTPVYEVRVQAMDQGPVPRSAHAKVLIEIIDVNDNSPEISVTSLMTPVREDAELGTIVALVTVSDKDGGNNGVTHCKVVGSVPFKLQSNYKNDFSLVVDGPLDRENTPIYNVTITATDEGGPPLSSMKVVTVHVSDVNDNAPLFKEPVINVYLKENSPTGSVIYTITAFDSDLDTNAKLTYTLLESSQRNIPISSVVNINSETGDIVSLQSFNFEELKTFQFKVQATDSGVPPLSSNVTVNVFVLDENDNSPSILAPYSEHGSVNSESIPYSAEAGYFVAKIRAVDADSGYNALLSYHLSDKKYFEVNLRTGNLFVNERIDREELCPTLVKCSMKIQAVLNNPMTAHRVEVNVLDINDNSPAFNDKTYSLNISESSLTGERYILPIAEDADTGINTVKSYKLSQNEHFSLDVQSGGEHGVSAELVLQKALDREKQSMIRLLLTAIDGGKPPRSGTIELIVNVIDVNDNIPTFSKSLYKVRVQENAIPGTVVVKLNATDLDEGMNSKILYSLVKRGTIDRSNIFDVNSESGEITVKGTLDYEDTPAYEVRVQAMDQGTVPRSAHAKLLIEVIDVNDNAPEISVTSLMTPVKEDAELGAIVALVTVSDKDGGNNGVTHCKVVGSVPFKLQSNYKNDFSLVVDGPLDRENTPIYNVTITATDEGSPPLSSMKVVTVHVSDVNDNAPLFKEPVINVYLKENSPTGSVIYTITAFDPDLDTNAKLTYTLLESSQRNIPISSVVNINSETGDIVSLDREKQAVIKLTLTAIDGGKPPKSGTLQINVNVLDVNDNTPTFSKTLYKARVNENAPAGSLVIQLNATDLDEGDNGRVVYSFVKRGNFNPADVFSMNIETGEITVKGNLDYETQAAYEIHVQASDRGSSPRRANGKLLVEVVDVNDNAPEIVMTSLTNPVKEDAETGSIVALVTVTDKDGGRNGQTNCKLIGSTPFKLNSNYKNYYSLAPCLYTIAQKQQLVSLETTVFVWLFF
uniref:Cadherin domain-containing protein n=1 Tax=Anabas testudineus TaxID=64144 RepID=A0AAQ6I8V2_ANATE